MNENAEHKLQYISSIKQGCNKQYTNHYLDFQVVDH